MAKANNTYPTVRMTQLKRREATREKLLYAAVELICKRGYAELTTTNIAKRAGLTRGALQHHFGNVEDVCLAVVDDFGSRLDFAGFESAAFRTRNLQSSISAAVDFYWKNFRTPRYIAVMFIWLGFLNNKKLYSQLALRMEHFERQFDREWQARFRHIGIPNKKIAAARHIAVSALRGFAIRSIYRGKASEWRDEINLLKRMLFATLQ